MEAEYTYKTESDALQALQKRFSSRYKDGQSTLMFESNQLGGEELPMAIQKKSRLLGGMAVGCYFPCLLVEVRLVIPH
jgi:hypothetical protein